MKEEDWLKLYDQTVEKFEWFIKKFTPEKYSKLIDARSKNSRAAMLPIMNDIWFVLPDSQFNIVENPKGWSEFLDLIEI